jgi:hypothetical protein
MARSRGLITDTEKGRIPEDADIEDSKRYQAISRVRRRIKEELPQEIALLREEHPELLNELRDVVFNCKYSKAELHYDLFEEVTGDTQIELEVTEKGGDGRQMIKIHNSRLSDNLRRHPELVDDLNNDIASGTLYVWHKPYDDTTKRTYNIKSSTIEIGEDDIGNPCIRSLELNDIEQVESDG